MNDYNFGNFVCMLREKKGLTQANVAELLNVTPAAVSKWENGSSKPRVEVLFKLAEILEVRPEELMAGHYMPEESLNPDIVAEINERYEYLRKIDSYNTPNAKIKRMVAWFIDWNIIGFASIITAVAFLAFVGNKISTTLASITMLFIILSFPICFILRDVIGNGRSLGKRIMGLVVLDKQTGNPANLWKCLLRNLFIFLFQIDVVIMLITGCSVGDFCARTVVVPKKALEDSADSDTYDDHIKKINGYKPASKNVKNIIILLAGMAAAFILFVLIILLIVFGSLKQAQQTEEYEIAYTYLTESEEFKALDISEKKIKFNSYSINSFKEPDGSVSKTAEFGFRIKGYKEVNIICHFENGEWYVCTECTHLK